MENRSKIELLAPAGNLEIFYSVLAAGADAVYLGGNLFGARAYAMNFSEEEIIHAIEYAHLFGRKVYLTINTLLKNSEIRDQLFQYLLPFYKAGLDAVIVQDLGVAQFIKNSFPELALHASTQLSISSSYGAHFLRKHGFSRIVPARELSLDEINLILNSCNIELETFIHGAMCYCYSGQCLFSSLLGGRSGNRGRCSQPCRLPYDFYDHNHKLIKKEQFLLSMKDMNTLPILNKLIESGICSFKIEGRMKQKEYAQGVVSIYRRFLDHENENHSVQNATILQEAVSQLTALGSRSGFSNGYYEQYNGASMITMDSASYRADSTFIQPEAKLLQLKMNGFVTAKIGQPFSIQIFCEEQDVRVSGPILESAQNAPTTKQQIFDKMAQLGDTVFFFDFLEINMDDHVFVPASVIKRLRREAIERIQSKLLEGNKRNTEAIPCFFPFEMPPIPFELTVSVQTLDQLIVIVKKEEACQIILSLDLWTTQKKHLISLFQQYKKPSYILEFPWVFRNATKELLDPIINEEEFQLFSGVIVNSLDGLEYASSLKEKGFHVLAGQSIYQWNDSSSEMIAPIADQVTVPYEFNKKELWGLSNKNALLTVYGYLPVMVTSQCLFLTSGKCNANKQSGYLRDRYDKEFYVEATCKQCGNIIYNSEPLCLLQHYRTLGDHGFHNFKIDFHQETAQQVETVLGLFSRCRSGHLIKAEDIPFSYTNGHFKRGVE